MRRFLKTVHPSIEVVTQPGSRSDKLQGLIEILRDQKIVRWQFLVIIIIDSLNMRNNLKMTTKIELETENIRHLRYLRVPENPTKNRPFRLINYNIVFFSNQPRLVRTHGYFAVTINVLCFDSL